MNEYKNFNLEEDEYTEPMECDTFMELICILFSFAAILIYANNVSHSPKASKEAIGAMFIGILFKSIIIILLIKEVINI